MLRRSIFARPAHFAHLARPVRSLRPLALTLLLGSLVGVAYAAPVAGNHSAPLGDDVKITGGGAG